MRGFYKTFKRWSIIATMVILIVVLTSATYAWFTSNQTVSSERATARSGTDTLELQMSGQGGDAFQTADEVAIVQVNEANAQNLMPVSTSDLKNFVYSPSTNQNNEAATFVKVENEAYYYHGRIYVRALSEGASDTAKMALYLDEDAEAGGELVSAEDGQLLNAARLGLTFDGANPVIYYLSEKENEGGGQQIATVLNGTPLEAGQVIDSSGGTLTGVKDPAVPISTNRIIMDDTKVTLPESPLLVMELNKVYTVDIYFYIEGCDPDCTNVISLNAADMHLAFYGIMEE